MREKKDNYFKMLESQEEIPASIKDKVMNDVRLTYLLGDVTELYTARMGMTIAEVIHNDNGMDQKFQDKDLRNRKTSKK